MVRTREWTYYIEWIPPASDEDMDAYRVTISRNFDRRTRLLKNLEHVEGKLRADMSQELVDTYIHMLQ